MLMLQASISGDIANMRGEILDPNRTSSMLPLEVINHRSFLTTRTAPCGCMPAVPAVSAWMDLVR